MTRNEFVLRLVLDSICDDYENVDQIILRQVSEDTAKCGLIVDRPEIVEALARLIERGWSKAYLLSGTEPFSRELEEMPSLDIIEEHFKTYFYITKKGKEVQLADESWWPFDEEGKLLPNWQLDVTT